MSTFIQIIDAFLLKQAKRLFQRFPSILSVSYTLLAFGLINACWEIRLEDKVVFVITLIFSIFYLWLLYNEILITTARKRFGMDMEATRKNSLYILPIFLLVWFVIEASGKPHSPYFIPTWVVNLSFMYLTSSREILSKPSS